MRLSSFLNVTRIVSQVSPSFLDMPEAQQSMRQKPFKIFDVNLTDLGFVDRLVGYTL